MLEAMKMQNSLLSTKTSKVSACSLFILLLLLLLPFFSMSMLGINLKLEKSLYFKNIYISLLDL